MIKGEPRRPYVGKDIEIGHKSFSVVDLFLWEMSSLLVIQTSQKLRRDFVSNVPVINESVRFPIMLSMIMQNDYQINKSSHKVGS